MTKPSDIPPPDPPRRGPSPRARRALVALVLVVMIAAGATLALLLSSGGGPSTSSIPPSASRAPTPPPSSTPRRTGTRGRHRGAHPRPAAPKLRGGPSPPFGFSGVGWSDLCYRRVATAAGYTQERVPDTTPCPAGSTRITGERQIELSARAGANTDRMGATWGVVQPHPPDQVAPGQPRYNWAPVVKPYREMLQRGIRPIVVASGSPTWARSPAAQQPGACVPPGLIGCAFPPDPAHLADWRNFVRGVMVHLPRMLALEVWNEPNSARFFAPHPSPALYARMLEETDQAAKSVGFDRPIITGGLTASNPANPGKMPPAEFLSRIYELAGKGAFDGIGTHPYPTGPPWVGQMTANLDQLRAVRRRFHDSATPLWITEIGVGGTPTGSGEDSVPLDQQGPVLARMYRSVQGRDVRSFMIYTLYDSHVGGARFGPFGVLTPELRPKPAYCYVAQHIGGTPCR